MKSWLHVVLMCAMCAWVSSAHAQPAATPTEALAAASKLTEPAQILAKIEEGLALDAKHKGLLELKADTLVATGDYVAARGVLEALLAAGVPAARRREIKRELDELKEADGTFVEVTAPGGRFEVSVKGFGSFCVAAPTCRRQFLRGQYRFEAKAKGFTPWSGVVAVASGKTTAVVIASTELPSLLTVQGAPTGATITVDAQPYTAPVQVPAGPHKVAVTAERYAPFETDVVAALGEPIVVTLELSSLVPVRLVPPEAELLLDGKPVKVTDGKIVVPKGAKEIVARAPGHLERRVPITPGAPSIDVVLQADKPVAVTPPPPSRFTTMRKVAIGTAGLSVASLGLAVVLGRSSGIKEDQAFERCPVPDQCAEPDQANADIDEAQSLATKANILYGVAGGAAAATVMLWILGTPDSHESRPIAITPTLGRSPGIAISGSF